MLAGTPMHYEGVATPQLDVVLELLSLLLSELLRFDNDRPTPRPTAIEKTEIAMIKPMMIFVIIVSPVDITGISEAAAFYFALPISFMISKVTLFIVSWCS
jgi:hypothetical protein